MFFLSMTILTHTFSPSIKYSVGVLRSLRSLRFFAPPHLPHTKKERKTKVRFRTFATLSHRMSMYEINERGWSCQRNALTAASILMRAASITERLVP